MGATGVLSLESMPASSWTSEHFERILRDLSVLIERVPMHCSGVLSWESIQHRHWWTMSSGHQETLKGFQGMGLEI